MKTIYTDKLGAYPWLMLFGSGLAFLLAYEASTESDGNRLGLYSGMGGFFLFLAFKRFWDIRQTKREGRDPTILRIK